MNPGQSTCPKTANRAGLRVYDGCTMTHLAPPAPQPPNSLFMAPAVADGDACYQAMLAHDARFDGRFFTAVTSTGIYCRPICRVRTPKRSNCLFFSLAAQAEQAGYRPCLRCRPELAPAVRHWSSHDAGNLLLQQACKLLEQPHQVQFGPQAETGWSVAALARRLGVSERHVRRIFQEGLGVSPLQYLLTQRLLSAKQLLTDTQLPMTDVAHLSGFGSVRRFNAALKEHYALTPVAMRRDKTTAQCNTAHHGAGEASGARVALAYRPPYAVDAMLVFFALRAVPGVERVDVAQRRITRTLSICDPENLAPAHIGWLQVTFDNTRPLVHLNVSDGLCRALPTVINQVRHWLDLDAEPTAVAHALAADFPHAQGVRLPGALDGFELAVRAVLGQQITVQAATRQLGRLVRDAGSKVQTPWPELDRLMPTPHQMWAVPEPLLGDAGIFRQRQTALKALAHAVLFGGLELAPNADPQTTEAALLALPGIGPWTASYVLMRALHWPNAFPAQDVVLQNTLGTRGVPHSAQVTEQRASTWQPWRSYAVMCLWQGMTPARNASNTEANYSIK